MSKISFYRFSQKVLRIMFTLFLSIIACLMIVFIILLRYSPGKAKPLLDDNGKEITAGISEKIYVNINGCKQGMFIKGTDKSKPVLLFVHGGPGMPEYAISREYPLVLEKYFTVCWWEQRAAGLSYDSGMKADQLSFNQLISDLIEVAKYLRKRFGQEKIYLMAHSGGTFIGIQAAAKAPELFKTYIAVAQISNQLQSEKLAYYYMKEEYSRQADKKMLKMFERYPLSSINTASYYSMRDKPMHELGIGTTHKMHSVFSGIFLPVMTNREYSLTEKINIWRGKYFTTHTSGLWNKLVLTDLTKKITKLEIPAYFVSGIYDYTVSYTLAKDYLNKLQAPDKMFYSFQQSAHSPLFEEPEKMSEVIEDILLRTSVDKNTNTKIKI